MGKQSTGKRTKVAFDQLKYVSDQRPGIQRIGSKRSFLYRKGGKPVRAKHILARIQALAIPPAWTDVWISPDPNGHLQATGRDARGRKQYRYHARWNRRRNLDKFSRLVEIGHSLPALRQRLEADLSRSALDGKRVLATIISLMEETMMRIGNADYERQNGSFGITTLKDRHVEVGREQIRFSFRGKSGVYHDISLRNKRLARIVKQCRDIPGQELFQYYDVHGRKRAVDSGQVNAYLKEATGCTVTAKDLRTWAGSLQAWRVIQELSKANGDINVNEVLDEVSRRLGNSRNVCGKYYIHPYLLRICQRGQKNPLPEPKKSIRRTKYFASDEYQLLRLLKRAPDAA